MKNHRLFRVAVLAALLLGNLLQPVNAHGDPLPSWRNTANKKAILDFVKIAVKKIPVQDRIAVFDMDGTIACEAPLWFEMYAAVDGLNRQSEKNPELMRYPEYRYAKKLAANPADTSVTNNWVKPGCNYIDSMVWKAYKGVDHETYVKSARAYLKKTRNQNYDIILANMFYQPMIELIRHLKANKFTVYVVSGSVQGVIWSVCPEVIGLDRAHLIGTRQILNPVYKAGEHRTAFMIQEGIFTPKDDNNGKSENIYAHIGKTPVFAFGNTNGDFGMFHLTSTSSYPHMELLLNHDDKHREYRYPPYHGAPVEHWRDSLKVNNWKLVNMETEFRTVWKKGSLPR
jgi:beta-phosphoglucomutase-like phosphatase (HAD superfamily)